MTYSAAAAALYVTRPYPQIIPRLSFASAYPALFLLCLTLALGPWKLLAGEKLAASFDQEPVRGWCLSLRWHEFSMMMKAPAGSIPRDIFKVSVNQLICYLDGLAGMALYERRKIRDDDSGGPTLLR